MFGGIEVGGTKWVCATSDGADKIERIATFPTTTPDETIKRALEFFTEHGPVSALGIGSFGPIDINPHSPSWGYITATPKPGWTDVDLVSPFEIKLNVSVGFDTDVNAAALGEWVGGAAAGLDMFSYVTVGTGIGAGILLRGDPWHGLLHPEIGHIRVPHSYDIDPFEGSCKFHGDCFEGLASGEAMRKRWGHRAELIVDESAWILESEYLALGLVNLICTYSPQRIILGGGVMDHPGLLQMTRESVLPLLGGYFRSPELASLVSLDQYLVSPGLGERAGVLGAIELAKRSLKNRQ